MLVITTGRVMNVLTGTSATPSIGGTVLAGAHLHGFSLLFASRVLPIGLQWHWRGGRCDGSVRLHSIPFRWFP